MATKQHVPPVRMTSAEANARAVRLARATRRRWMLFQVCAVQVVAYLALTRRDSPREIGAVLFGCFVVRAVLAVLTAAACRWWLVPLGLLACAPGSAAPVGTGAVVVLWFWSGALLRRDKERAQLLAASQPTAFPCRGAGGPPLEGAASRARKRPPLVITSGSGPGSGNSPAAPRLCSGCGATVAEPRCGGCGAAVRVGDYVVERVLAQNARGRVYVAAGPSGERVVLKELVFRTVPGASQVDGFEREAEVLAQLDHPRIPRFIGTIHDGEGVHLRLYLVQQFIEGRTLLAELAEGPLREKELRQVAEQCLEVLVYLQGLHLLHRDIKPANLLRDAAGELWLVDFGTARALNHDETHRATLVGTFGYAPPEQLGGTVDVTSDLYGLGATLIHLASGVAPDTMIDPGLNLNFERAVRVSWRFRVFLRKLVSRNRADRPQSPDEAMELLHARGPALWPRFRAVSWSQHVIPTPLAVALFVVPIPLAIVVANLVMQQRDNTRREVALRAAAPAPAARPTPANPPKSVPAEPQPLKVGTSNDIASDAGASTR